MTDGKVSDPHKPGDLPEPISAILRGKRSVLMLETKRLWLLILIPVGMRIFHFLVVCDLAIHEDVAAQESRDSVKYVFEEIVVTASRRSTSNLVTSGSVESIDRSTWQERNGQVVTDVLELSGGVDIRDYGGVTGAKIATMRGATGQQVIVLRDGIRISNPALGLADLSLLNLDNVDRIEIYRGGASSLYGADAVGGVINIISDHSAKPLSAQVHSSISTFSHSVFSGAVALPLGEYQTGFSFRHEDMPDSSYSVRLRSPRRSVRRVNSAFKVNLMEGHVSRTDPTKSIVLSGQWLTRDAGLPGTIANNSSALSDERQVDRNWMVSLQGSWTPAARWQTAGAASFSQTRIEYDDSEPFIRSQTQTKSFQARAVNTLIVAPWNTLTTGYDWSATTADGFSKEGEGGFQTDARFNTPFSHQHGVFIVDIVEWRWKSPLADILRLDPSCRFDRSSYDDGEWSPRLGLSIIKRHASWYHTLRGSFSRNFRAPTLNERYWVGDGALGNPDIKPERSITWDAGLIAGMSKGGIHTQFEFNLYRILSTDQIVWSMENPITPVNLRKTRATGQELMGRLLIDSTWRVAAAFTRNRAMDLSDPNRSYRSINSPLYTSKLSVEFARHRFTVHASYRYSSERFIDAQNTRALKPYWLVDAGLAVKWKFDRLQGRLLVDMKNALDKAYEVTPAYPGMARELVIGLDISY